MNDFDRSNEETTPGRPAPNTAFRRAMIGVAERCGRLTTRLSNQNVEGAEDAIRSAVTLWIAGREACLRVIESNRENSPYARAARQLLEDTYGQLLETIRCAREILTDLRVRRAMDGIRITLVQTMSQPLTECRGQRGKHYHSE
jgi:hypothetical protein